MLAGTATGEAAKPGSAHAKRKTFYSLSISPASTIENNFIVRKFTCPKTPKKPESPASLNEVNFSSASTSRNSQRKEALKAELESKAIKASGHRHKLTNLRRERNKSNKLFLMDIFTRKGTQ
jgi:predicted alpha/beta superfamily hydrolase